MTERLPIDCDQDRRAPPPRARAPAGAAPGRAMTAAPRIPNRHERRRQAARQRRKRHDAFYRDYVRHLPQVPLDAPLKSGKLYHLVFAHDDDCAIYNKPNGSLADCTCDPVVSRHVEPRRA